MQKAHCMWIYYIVGRLLIQPRSQGFSLFVIGKAGKALAPGGHMTFNTQI